MIKMSEAVKHFHTIAVYNNNAGDKDKKPFGVNLTTTQGNAYSGIGETISIALNEALKSAKAQLVPTVHKFLSELKF